MQQTMVSSSVASGRPAARASFRRSPVKRLVVVADRKPLVVNAALATRAPPTFLQPVPWIEIFQALVLPVPVAAKPKPVAEEECPWIDEMENSHRHPMYFSHLADRMAMEPQDQ